MPVPSRAAAAAAPLRAGGLSRRQVAVRAEQARAAEGDYVSVHYTGTLDDGGCRPGGSRTGPMRGPTCGQGLQCSPPDEQDLHAPRPLVVAQAPPYPCAGSVFDSSRKDGRSPLEFQIGAGKVIKVGP
jgi:hypothetical protein